MPDPTARPVYTADERAAFLRDLAQGFGRVTAAERRGHHYRVFTRTLRRVKGFAAEVRRAERKREEWLESALYAEAMRLLTAEDLDRRDHSVAFRVLGRWDRARELAAQLKAARDARDAGRPATAPVIVNVQTITEVKQAAAARLDDFRRQMAGMLEAPPPATTHDRPEGTEPDGTGG